LSGDLLDGNHKGKLSPTRAMTRWTIVVIAAIIAAVPVAKDAVVALLAALRS
jgi:hypothetical protein